MLYMNIFHSVILALVLTSHLTVRSFWRQSIIASVVGYDLSGC